MSLFFVLKNTFQIAMKGLCVAPLLLLLVQFPLALTEILQEVLGINNSIQPPIGAILIILPAFFILSFFSSALTFAATRRLVQAKPHALHHVWEDIKPHIGKLLAASVTFGCLSGLGLVAYIVPGLILMTLFLFVPHLIIADSSNSLWAYATRSKKLVANHPFFSFFVVMCSFSLSTVLYLLGEHLGTYYGAVGSNDEIRVTILVTIRSVFAMVGGLAVDLWVASYFMTLRKDA